MNLCNSHSCSTKNTYNNNQVTKNASSNCHFPEEWYYSCETNFLPATTLHVSGIFYLHYSRNQMQHIKNLLLCHFLCSTSFILLLFSELYEYCLNENIADKNLIAKWKKQGYENLCCLRCIQARDTNFGTSCICRVPKAKLEEVSFTISIFNTTIVPLFQIQFGQWKVWNLSQPDYTASYIIKAKS